MNLTNYRFCQQLKRVSGIFLICNILFFAYVSGSAEITGPEIRNKVKVVVIDPGHGGRDPGALGSIHKEKDIVLAVSLKLGEYIEQHFDDVQIIYTREKDIHVPLDERAAIANKNKADLFISIHANASPRAHSVGTETFVMGATLNERNLEVAKLENSVITLEEDYTTKYEGFDPNNPESYIVFSLLQHTHLEQSLNFASLVQNQFRERARRLDRGVKQAGFVVLWQTTMPSVLVELGFISHPGEEKYMASKQGQEHLASAIFRAFREYKEEIESSSNFENFATAEAQSNATPDRQFYFKVQLFSTRNKVPIDDKLFEGLENPEIFIEDPWYKYAIGKFVSYEDALKYTASIQSKFKGAFVIAIHNGQIVPVEKAISELGRNNR